MQIRVVTLRYSETLQGFPEDALRAATFGREVLNASEHFFVHGNVPHLTLVLSLGDSPHAGQSGPYRLSSRVRQFDEGTIDEVRLVQCAVSADGASRWFGFKGILGDWASKEGSSSGSNRVKRGGSWNNNADNCTSSNRNNNNPSNENNNNGFRLVSTVSEQAGFHFDAPESPFMENEHAWFRPTGSVSDRRAEPLLKDYANE